MKEGDLAVVDIGGEKRLGTLTMHMHSDQAWKCKWAGRRWPFATTVLYYSTVP